MTAALHPRLRPRLRATNGPGVSSTADGYFSVGRNRKHTPANTAISTTWQLVAVLSPRLSVCPPLPRDRYVEPEAAFAYSRLGWLPWAHEKSPAHVLGESSLERVATLLNEGRTMEAANCSFEIPFMQGVLV